MRWQAAAIGLLIVVGAACGEDVDVSRDEAIEVLVLDGVARDRAICIVDGAAGVVSYAKVTGVDPEISEDELADLAAVSADCVFDRGADASLLRADGPEGQLGISEGGGLATDITRRVEELVTGGLDPNVGQCVEQALRGSADPEEALANPNFITEAIRVCDR